MNLKKKIITVLPYKENYTKNEAAAASLWVAEFFKNSKYKNVNTIIGSTNFTKNYLSKNYFNILERDIKKKLTSTTKNYCNKIISYLKNQNIDLIEIHNRPNVFNYLVKNIKSKYILYFHNDPLSMNGSKLLKERIHILNKVDCLIFVSQWTRDRFFIDIDKKLSNKSRVIYPSVNKKNKFIKKEKKILF